MATVKKYRCGSCGAWLVLEPCDPPGKAYAGSRELVVPFHGGKLPKHKRSQRSPGDAANCDGSGQMPAEAGPQAPLYFEDEAETETK